MSGRVTLPDIMYLQGVVVFIVFCKIQCFRLGGNTLAGIVLEFSAALLHGDDSFFRTKDIFFIQLCAVDAVCAGTRDFLAKQHGHDLFG